MPSLLAERAPSEYALVRFAQSRATLADPYNA